MDLFIYGMSDAVKAANLKRRGSKHTDETRKKMSSSHLEHWSTHQHHNTGRKLSENHKQKISNGLIGRIITNEQKEKTAKSNSKLYIIEFINGEKQEIIGLKSFAKEKAIPYVTLRKAYEKSIGVLKYDIKKIL